MRRGPPTELDTILNELMAQKFDSLEEVQEFFGGRVAAYNATPQEELGGLTPDQMAQLLDGDWYSFGAMRLDMHLTAADLRGSDAFHNAREIMRYVADHGPLKLTDRGNLTRKDLLALVPRLQLDVFEQELLQGIRALNERSLVRLPQMRGLLRAIEILRGRKTLSITRMGRNLLEDQFGGALFYTMFARLFRSMPTGQLLDPELDEPYDREIAVIMYRLALHAADWISEPALYDAIWPPATREALGGDGLAPDEPLRGLIMRLRLMEPLAYFGLIDVQDALGPKGLPSYRLSALFKQFVRFEFDAAPPGPSSSPITLH